MIEYGFVWPVSREVVLEDFWFQFCSSNLRVRKKAAIALGINLHGGLMGLRELSGRVVEEGLGTVIPGTLSFSGCRWSAAASCLT